MSYIKLFLIFLKIGLFSIGGGLSMLPLLKQEIVNRGWMTSGQFVDMIAISESTPGPIGVNMATYVGFQTGGVLGSIVATLGTITPSLIIITVIAHFFMKFNENPLVKSAFYGLRPAVTGLIGAACFEVIKVSLINLQNFVDTGAFLKLFEFKAIILFAVILFISKKWDKHPIFYISIAALIGVVFKY